MLVVHTNRYDEAEKLITHALAINPDGRPRSIAWAGCAIAKAATAKRFELLQKAYAEFPDAEIAAHLGEVLWISGDKDKARTVWEQGTKTDPENVVLRETVKRLNP